MSHSPQPLAPRGMVRFNFVGFAEDSIEIFPGNCPDFCTHTHVHTQGFFLGGGVGHILLDKNACYRELFPDPAETSENRANMRIPTSTLYFFAHGRISYGTDSHGA